MGQKQLCLQRRLLVSKSLITQVLFDLVSKGPEAPSLAQMQAVITPWRLANQTRLPEDDDRVDAVASQLQDSEPDEADSEADRQASQPKDSQLDEADSEADVQASQPKDSQPTNPPAQQPEESGQPVGKADTTLELSQAGKRDLRPRSTRSVKTEHSEPPPKSKPVSTDTSAEPRLL